MDTEQEVQSQSGVKRFMFYGGLAIPVVAVGILTAFLLFGVSLKIPLDAGMSRTETTARPEAGLAGLVRHAEPRPVPDLVFEDASGQKRRLSEWRGRAVLLNLWATWCAPCKVEMPALDRLQAKAGGAAFEVIALSTDRAGARLPRAFYEQTGIRHLALYVDDTAEANVALKPGGLPATLVIDAQGREVARLLGPAEWDAPEAVRAIEAALGVTLSAN